MKYTINQAETNSLQKIDQDGFNNVSEKHQAVAEELISEILEALSGGNSITITPTRSSAKVTNIRPHIPLSLVIN